VGVPRKSSPPRTPRARRCSNEKKLTKTDQLPERRIDRAQDSIEIILDGLFHPRQWASRLALTVGLQRTNVELDRTTVAAPGKRPGPPLRIAFASDFHAGATTSRRILEAACSAIANEKPDLLLLGGDFVTTRAGYIDHLAPLLAAIPAPLGKFGVFGNHDRRANRAILTRALGEAGVQMLVNESVTLASPHEDVAVIGLDDPVRGHPQFPDGVRAPVQIVLMHAPDGMLTLGKRPFDLALCGHTHGGQIAIGPVRPYMPHGKLSRAYPGGHYRVGDDSQRTMIVSRGVGCSTIPIRLGATPQVHLVTVGTGT
jgi:predicted MPP superfamily phosphohydrolase